jgi:thiol-disulfide isomerase/thioredoxin
MIISIKNISNPYIYFSIILIMLTNITCNANNIPESIKKIKVEEQIKNLPNVSFTNLENKSKTLYGLSKDKLLIINFWALWCVPCVKEMPALNNLSKKLKNSDVKIIYINQDSFKDYDKIKSFIKKLGFEEKNIFTDFDMSSNKTFKLRGIPTTLISNKAGEVLWRIEGIIDWESKDIVSWLKNEAKRN